MGKEKKNDETIDRISDRTDSIGQCALYIALPAVSGHVSQKQMIERWLEMRNKWNKWYEKNRENQNEKDKQNKE